LALINADDAISHELGLQRSLTYQQHARSIDEEFPKRVSRRDSVGWQLTATWERYPATKIAILFVSVRSPEVAGDEVPRPGRSHMKSKGLVRFPGAGSGGRVAKLNMPSGHLISRVHERRLERRHGADGVGPATDAPGEKSAKGSGYPRVGLRKRVEEKFCGASEIQVRGWVPRKRQGNDC
jgi:hypothetical protein